MHHLLLSLDASLMGAPADTAAESTGTSMLTTIRGLDLNSLIPAARDFGIKLVAAILILVVGRIVARLLCKTAKHLMTSRNVEATVISFTTSFAYAVLMAFVIIAAIGELGVQTLSFVAVLGAAGLAIGLALQGTLSSFAAGTLLIIFRPFKVGDYIEGGDASGTVEEVQIFTTTLTTPDNRRIIVPNSKMNSGNIINYSAMETRRIDLAIGISYGDDIDKARKLILEVLQAEKEVLEDPPPIVAVDQLADSSVNFVVRPWVKSTVYFDVKFALVEAIKKKLDAGNITIPFPQQDVHLYQHK